MMQKSYLKRVRRPQTAFTLIELTIILAISGIVIGGIWLGASSVFETNRAREFQEQIVNIAQESRKLYSGNALEASNANITVALLQAGVIPITLARDPSNLALGALTPWNSRFQILFEPTPKRIKLRLLRLPSAPCNKLLNSFLGISPDSLPFISLRGGNLFDRQAGQNPTQAEITTACNITSDFKELHFSL